VEYRYSSGGTFTVRLDVTDDAGAVDDKVRLVRVEIPADEPVAEFSVTCEGLSCTLDAGSSTASDGSIARYDWSFGDGTTATGGAVSHAYSQEGRYTVMLKVTDSNQASGVSKRTIEVEAEDEEPISLAATRVESKRTAVRLEWSGANGADVAVFRDGRILATVADSGTFTDQALLTAAPTVRYRVCEASGERCSNPVKVALAR
jgi:PKD repeat protein